MALEHPMGGWMMVDGGDLILIYRFEEYEEWGFNRISISTGNIKWD